MGRYHEVGVDDDTCTSHNFRSIALTVLLFFFNDTATTEIYTLSLHDAFPISTVRLFRSEMHSGIAFWGRKAPEQDRKSTRLNSSHVSSSYAVFCLKKKRAVRSGHAGQMAQKLSVGTGYLEVAQYEATEADQLS